MRQRLYYGWVVVGVTFVTILVSSGVRSAPGVFIYPVEVEFNWNRAAISFAVSIGLLMFGAIGPFAGRLMDRTGPRLPMIAGLLLIAASMGASVAMTELWHLDLLWGVFSGIGSGLIASVLSVAVANRWFVAQRGLVLGILGSATSVGQLLFLPLLMWLVVSVGWRGGTLALVAAALLVLVPVLLLMRNDPADLHLQPYGGTVAAAQPAAADRGGATMQAVRSVDFWLLLGTYFVCGATANGLIGTHLIPHSIDHGIPEMTVAPALALMSIMNFVGTMGSGWLTDRVDKRALLAVVYALRGFSLFLLPFVGDFWGLAIFAVIFGLDFVATVPPTAALAADLFGRKNVGVIFGWLFFGHQIGAALAAWLGGVARVTFGDYHLTFVTAGVIGLMGALMALRVNGVPKPVPMVVKEPA